MSERFFVSPSGAYLGAFVDGAEPPAGAIEVPSVPASGSQVWEFETQAWGPVPPAPPLPSPVAKLAAFLQANPDVAALIEGGN